MNLEKFHDPKSIHQNHLHFYILTIKKSERAIKESIPFHHGTKIIKYLGWNLPKERKELYIENFKTLVKETKEDINRWDIPCSWVGKSNILKMKMIIVQNAICRFNVIPDKLPMFSREVEQKFHNSYGNTKDPK